MANESADVCLVCITFFFACPHVCMYRKFWENIAKLKAKLKVCEEQWRVFTRM